MKYKISIFSNTFYNIYHTDLFVFRTVMLSAFTKLYSSADNLVGVIYENFEQLGSSKLADIWTIRNITQKNFFGARSPVANCKLQTKQPSLDHAGLAANHAWVRAEKLNIQACAL